MPLCSNRGSFGNPKGNREAKTRSLASPSVQSRNGIHVSEHQKARRVGKPWGAGCRPRGTMTFLTGLASEACGFLRLERLLQHWICWRDYGVSRLAKSFGASASRPWGLLRCAVLFDPYSQPVRLCHACVVPPIAVWMVVMEHVENCFARPVFTGQSLVLCRQCGTRRAIASRILD